MECLRVCDLTSHNWKTRNVGIELRSSEWSQGLFMIPSCILLREQKILWAFGKKRDMCCPRHKFSFCFLCLFLNIEYREIQNARYCCFCFFSIGISVNWVGQSISVWWRFSVFIRSESESFTDKMENSCSLLGNNHSPQSSLIRNLKTSNLFWAKVS